MIEKLYVEYNGVLEGLAKRKMPEADALDAVAEVWSYVQRRPESLNGKEKSPLPYLMLLLNDRMNDIRRRSTRRAMVGLDDVVVADQDNGEGHWHRLAELKEMMAELPQPDRGVLHLSLVPMSGTQIAETFDMSPRSVRRVIKRSVASLRRKVVG